MIHLVRHGEAASESAGLSPTGRDQVSALAGRLAGSGVVAVRHGPALRTTETGGLLAAALGVADVAASDLLSDRTAVPSPACRSDYPAHRLPWLDAVPARERDIDGAAMSAAWRRIWQTFAATEPTTEVVLVTHSFVVAWFVREVLAAPAASWLQLAVANATLTSVDRDRFGEPRLETFNAQST